MARLGLISAISWPMRTYTNGGENKGRGNGYNSNISDREGENYRFTDSTTNGTRSFNAGGNFSGGGYSGGEGGGMEMPRLAHKGSIIRPKAIPFLNEDQR